MTDRITEIGWPISSEMGAIIHLDESSAPRLKTWATPPPGRNPPAPVRTVRARHADSRGCDSKKQARISLPRHGRGHGDVGRRGPTRRTRTVGGASSAQMGNTIRTGGLIALEMGDIIRLDQSSTPPLKVLGSRPGPLGAFGDPGIGLNPAWTRFRVLDSTASRAEGGIRAAAVGQRPSSTSARLVILTATFSLWRPSFPANLFSPSTCRMSSPSTDLEV